MDDEIDLKIQLMMKEDDKNYYQDLVVELRQGLMEIYAERGEDQFIANICNPLIEKSR